MKITMDHSTKVLLLIIVVLLAFLTFGVWSEMPSSIPKAHARGIPDSGSQLNKIIHQLDQIEKSLNGMQKLMVSGAVKVQVVESKDKKKDAPPKPILKVPEKKQKDLQFPSR